MTYLKLGQFMAMRFDILPAEVCNELGNLFERVPALPFETINSVIETEFDAPISELFARFNREPIAAASIAQVHEALSDRGERLAVKVQRPGIATLFETDMRILSVLATLIDWAEWFPGIVAKEIIDEFATYTRREMDFILEGRTAERLRLDATPNETVPRIYWDLTTPRVLTMQFIAGLSVAKASRLLHEQGIAAVRARVANFEPQVALHNFAFASLRQLFGTGFFHADPHPGNILLLDDNRIAFVDFGIFGVLTEERRKLLSGYIENVALGNIDESYRYYAQLSMPSGRTNLEAFKQETKAVLRRWYTASLRGDSRLRERHVGNVIGEMTDALRRHRVHVDMDTLLFWRAAIALDSSALSLSSDFDLIHEMRFYFAKEYPSIPQRMLRTMMDRERGAAERKLLVSAAQRARDVLGELADDRYAVALATEESARTRQSENRQARAISFALLSASALLLVLFVRDVVVGAFAVAVLLSLQMAMLLRYDPPHR